MGSVASMWRVVDEAMDASMLSAMQAECVRRGSRVVESQRSDIAAFSLSGNEEPMEPQRRMVSF